jgi:hypothetical protein
MLPSQALIVLKKRGYVIDTLYWAPEITIDNNLFEESCAIQNYNIWKNENMPILVLLENYASFKNRIDGVIVDNWLTKETFGPIAENCYDALSQIPNDYLSEWQKKLKEKFKEMIDKEKIIQA